jgi:hypothetical protein
MMTRRLLVWPLLRDVTVEGRWRERELADVSEVIQGQEEVEIGRARGGGMCVGVVWW